MAEEDTTGSSELARGHVTLTVAYKDAQKQVADDLKRTGEDAKVAGTAMGDNLHQGIVGGIQRGAADAKAMGGKLGTDTGVAIHEGVTGALSKTGEGVGTSIVDGMASQHGRLQAAAALFSNILSAPVELTKGIVAGAMAEHGGHVDELQSRYNNLSQSIINTKAEITRLNTEAKSAAAANVHGGNEVYDASKILTATAALEEYKKEQNKVAAAIEDVRSKTSNSSKELENEGKSILNFGIRTQGIANVLEGASGKIENMNQGVARLGIQGTEASEEVAGIGSALAGIVSDPVVLVGAALIAVVGTSVELTHKLYELGDQWEETMNSMAIETGASGEELEKLGGDVDRIAPNLALPMAQIGKDVAEVKRNFGDLDGADLQAITTQVGQLQKMVGTVDVRSVGQSFKAFGVTDANAQKTALDELFHGYQETGTSVDELSRDIANAEPTAAQFNLTWGQTAGLLTGFQTAGLNSSKALLALSSAQKALEAGKVTGAPVTDPAEMNKALADTLTQVKKLEDEGDRAGAKSLAEKLFGKSTGRGGGPADNILSLLQHGFDPTNFEASVNKVKDSIDGMYHQTETIGDKWTEFKNSTSVALQPLGKAVKEIVDKDLSSLVTWISAHQKDIVTFFGAAAIAATDFGQGIAVVIGGVIQIFGDLEGAIAKVSRGLGDVLGGVASAVEALPDWLGGGKEHARGIRDAANEVYNFGQEVQKTSDETTAFGRNVQDKANSMAASIRGQITEAVKETGAQIEHVNSAAENLVEAIRKVGEQHPKVDIDTDPAKAKMDDFLATYGKFFSGQPISPQIAAPSSNNPGALPPQFQSQPGLNLLPHADGGPIHGSGMKGKDSVPIYAAPGEHMWTADEVDEVGGHRAMYHLRAMARAGLLKHFDGGGQVDNPDPGRNFNPNMVIDQSMVSTSSPWMGLMGDQMFGRPSNWSDEPFLPPTVGRKYTPKDYIAYMHMMYGSDAAALGIPGLAGGGAIEDGPDVAVANSMVGTGYNQNSRNDCSGMVGRVVEGATGMGGPLPTTQNMGQWLAARGFVTGTGGPGMISVGWYNHGSAPNDGHAAMTLSNGENAEAGGSHGNFLVGSGAAGAGNSEFDHHMYLPQVYGEGSGGGSGVVGAFGSSGSGGGGATPAQIQSANDAVTRATGAVTVASQRLQEATNAPLATTKDGKLTKGAQESHDKAIAEAKAKLDAANRDLDTAKQQQSTILSGGNGSVEAAENAVTAAINRQTDAQTRLDAIRADPKAKPDQITAAQNQLAAATTKVTEAQQRLTDVQSKQADKAGNKKDSLVSGIGQIGGDFLKDNLPPGFSDPTQWPLVKTAGNLLKDIGGMVQDPTAKALLTAGGSAVGGDAGGAASALTGLFKPQPFGKVGVGSPGESPGVDAVVPPPGTPGASAIDPSALIPNMPNIGGAALPSDKGGDTHINASTTIHGKTDSATRTEAEKGQHRNVRTTIPRMVQQAR